jgi:hypothetical protein
VHKGRPCLSRFSDVYLHVAVCLAFHGDRPFEGALVLHADDDPTNNTVGNLRWGDRVENEADKRRNAAEREPATTTAVDEDGFDWSTGELQENA